MDMEQVVWIALNTEGPDEWGSGVFVFSTERRAVQFVEAMTNKTWKDGEEGPENWCVVRCLMNGTDCGHS